LGPRIIGWHNRRHPVELEEVDVAPVSSPPPASDNRVAVPTHWQALSALQQATGSKVEEENGCKRCERGPDLQYQYKQRWSWSPREPPDREERHDRYLTTHQQLPDMGGRALVSLTGSAEHRNVKEHRAEGSQ